MENIADSVAAYFFHLFILVNINLLNRQAHLLVN